MLRVRTSAVLLACVVTLWSASITADAADRTDTTTADVQPKGDLTATAEVSGVVYTSGGRSGPKCSWDRYTQFEFERATGVALNQPPRYDDPTDVEIPPEEVARRQQERLDWDEQEQRRRAQAKTTTLNGEAHYVYDVRCPGFTGVLRLVPVDVDATDLIPGAYDAATDRIETPIPNVSPAFEFAGYVNLGMWLAVEPTTIEPITAEAGPNTWITITPEHDSIDFDFDNGDTRTCEGFGVPIVDTDTFDEGPCGYTYRQSSPDDDPYQVQVGTTWNLPYDSSGGPGTLPAFTRTEVFAHNVDELQTVGRSN